MSVVSSLFETNKPIIFFAYGLTFFAMGLVVALQSRQTSRLELARSLNWLALFGIAHGLNEWGDLFIPMQRTYLSAPLVALLYAIQLILLALSFAFLFAFGVSLVRPFRQFRWLWAAPTGLFLIWLFLTFFVLTVLFPDQRTWHHVSNALARYFIAFPAALLAAYGLREQAVRRIRPLQAPAVYNALRVAGFCLVGYAILGGLVSLPIPFWPGNMINSATFQARVGVPPLVFRTIIGLVLAAAVIRALEIFSLEDERRIEELERNSIISAEREHMARELHDGAIQKVYTAGLLVQSAAKLTEPETELSRRLQRAVLVIDDSISDLRQNLAALHAEDDLPPQRLNDVLERVASDPHFTTMVRIQLDIWTPPLASLSAIQAGHVSAIVNEAMANILRHARARHVNIAAEDGTDRLRLSISDDGGGFTPDHTAGYGLRNMRDRAHLLDGTLEMSSTAGKGTTVTLDMPWSEDR